jgi:hypothetical protein
MDLERTVISSCSGCPRRTGGLDDPLELDLQVLGGAADRSRRAVEPARHSTM